MKNTSRTGAIWIPVLLVLVAVGGLTWGLSGIHLFHHPVPAKVASGVTTLGSAQQKLDAAQQRGATAAADAQQEVNIQFRQGQSYVAGTGEALAKAAPASREDPAVQVAARLNKQAGAAIEAAVGPLTKEQMDWVAELVKDATSASEASRATAEQKLAEADAALRESEQREALANQQVRQAKQDREAAERERDQAKTSLATAISERDELGAKLDSVLHWLLFGAILYAAIVYGLPLLANVIPALKPIEAAAHAILAPLAAKAWAEAEKLAQDATAALHHVIATVETGAPELLAKVKQIKGEWITEADGTAARAEAALRKANVL